MIKKIVLRKNLISFNLNHGRGYDCKEGVIYITYSDDSIVVLDVLSGCDITDCEYLFMKDTDETVEEILFKNIMFYLDEITG